MKLLCFAHRGEALSFFEHFNYVPTEHPALYQDEQSYLLLTGEGPLEALNIVSYMLGKYPCISEVFNFGVAGSLGRVNKNQVFELRHGYFWNQNKVEFKSYSLGLGEIDLVTSTERILDTELASNLRPIADLVDREAWGIGMSCKILKKPLRCFKYVSDMASEESICELIKSQAVDASDALLEKYLTLIFKPESENSFKISLPDFYFTVSMENEFEKVLERLSQKFQRPKESFLSLNLLNEIKEKTPNKKNRSKLLISFLKRNCDPEFYDVQDKLFDLFKKLKDENVAVSFDKNLESEELTIQFKASQDSIHHRLKMIHQIPWTNFKQILQGKD